MGITPEKGSPPCELFFLAVGRRAGARVPRLGAQGEPQEVPETFRRHPIPRGSILEPGWGEGAAGAGEYPTWQGNFSRRVETPSCEAPARSTHSPLQAGGFLSF